MAPFAEDVGVFPFENVECMDHELHCVEVGLVNCVTQVPLSRRNICSQHFTIDTRNYIYVGGEHYSLFIQACVCKQPAVIQVREGNAPAFC